MADLIESALLDKMERPMPHRPHACRLMAMVPLLILHGALVFPQTAADPLIGSWKLNRALSTFEPGPPPESRTTTFEMAGDALRHVTETQSRFQNERSATGLGGRDRVEYTAKFDGREYPITNSFLSTVSLKRIDSHTTERTGKIRGEVVETSTRQVSADGKTLTITTMGINDGMEYESVQVFDRAAP
jgi:hypothetical protein